LCHGFRAAVVPALVRGVGIAAYRQPAVNEGQSTTAALATVLGGSAVPYGYALTVWAAHGVLTNEHGNPDVWDLVLFIVGAVAAFALLGLVAGGRSARPLRTERRDLIRAGAIHVVAIGAAFAAAALIALIPSAVAWALGSFAATALYLSIASLEILVARRLDEDLDGRR
jgi:hypothetical protein